MGRRNTGFPTEVKEIIMARSDGMCEVMRPHCAITAVEIQHRRARAMGGTRLADANTASNGLAICRPCHNHVEAHPAEALERGWRLRQETGGAPTDPGSVMVWWRSSRWVLLDDSGGMSESRKTRSAQVFPRRAS